MDSGVVESDVFSSDSVYRKAIGAELESSKGEGDPLVLKVKWWWCCMLLSLVPS